NQIILKAMKKYGMFMADNGGDSFISGSPNANFDDNDLHLLNQITPNNAFEVVDTSSWIVNPNSGQVGGTLPLNPCDINGDGNLNAADIQPEVNAVLTGSTAAT